ncbi:hypothetical protein BDF20DRAFT_876706 [Mycotypha africana]|uniref:uncharacterized protein n=1 Tax=Mycotypha africana TaxID=64632 RepID=UPI002301A33A|nr:uncharacterized protein BDF20DRAFT_876706 [Mycotypha africana]KAI8975056.1 hypothetical protein BDF20DRAFT_876706 [Mycotypha africana]
MYSEYLSHLGEKKQKMCIYIYNVYIESSGVSLLVMECIGHPYSQKEIDIFFYEKSLMYVSNKGASCTWSHCA